VSSLNVGLDWGTVVMMLETRSRTMLAFDVSKEPGICFSTAWKVSLPPRRLSSKLPRRLSRGLGVAEYALWKSVSESSVVPVSTGVRAGVTGVMVRGRSRLGEVEDSAIEVSSLFFEEPEPDAAVVVIGGRGDGGRSAWAR